MLEKIYTIPLNEVFDACRDDGSRGCPFCALYDKLAVDEIDLILGASMMEPDVRIKTNKSGFCARHYKRMLTAKNRLGLALMMESHLAEVRAQVKDGAAALIKGKGTAAVARISALEDSCYICERIEGSFAKMLDNAVWLWEQDKAFRDKLSAQPCFCLPHYKRLIESARRVMNKKNFPAFYEACERVTMAYFDALAEDVSWFCKKFDYRYDAEPWGTAKDAPERTAAFLKSREELS